MNKVPLEEIEAGFIVDLRDTAGQSGSTNHGRVLGNTSLTGRSEWRWHTCNRFMLVVAMFRRVSVALVLTVLAAPPLLAQHVPLVLCLVQTKLDAGTQYDPPAGPWAMGLDQLLSAQRLRSGAPLQITVLAASTEKEVPPEVRRLHCPYVIQLRYHGSFWPGGRYVGDDEDSLVFYVWNGATGKVIAHGASLISAIPGQNRFSSTAFLTGPCAALTEQIMRTLNKLP